MAAIQALLAGLEGEEAYRRCAAMQLCGSPFMIRLGYLGGLPGFTDSNRCWVGRVGNRVRLVDQHGLKAYDLPLSRIQGIACREHGHLDLHYEPTPGLLTTVCLQLEDSHPDTVRKLFYVLAVSA